VRHCSKGDSLCYAMQLPCKLLTVGEGDFSCSVALQRAYGNQIQLVATCLPSRDEVLATYATAEANLRVLRDVHVRFEVDATKLQHYFAHDDNNDNKFDYILFHHPHLGGGHGPSMDDKAHAQQHASLLAHYFASARACLTTNTGTIHVCLGGNQDYSFQLRQTCRRLNLNIVDVRATSQPIFPQLQFDLQTLQNKAPRRFRNGKLKSRHWLGNYGYTHVHTFPALHTEAIQVAASKHYFLQTNTNNSTTSETNALKQQSICTRTCLICDLEFETDQLLQEHLLAPALPIITRKWNSRKDVLIEERTSNTLCTNVLLKSPLKSMLDCTLSNDARNQLPSKDFLVTATNNDKRLRWFLQHNVQLGSKRLCEQRIQQGNVLVNHQIATDSGRILKTGFIVSVFEDYSVKVRTTTATNSSIRSVASWPMGIEIVWKPVGMRVAGIFDTNSLESLFAKPKGYSVLSKLDRGCSGLVALQDNNFEVGSSITLGFTVLVHGFVPAEWNEPTVVNISMDGIRRWRKRPPVVTDQTEDAVLHCAVTIVLLEQTTITAVVDDERKQVPALSTLLLTTSSQISGLVSVLSYWLRKQGYPIVGDRFAGEEYLQLPRSMRNRLKQKICIGASRIVLSDHCHEEPLCHKWSANYWQTHCQQRS
jgi:hypothetical protein